MSDEIVLSVCLSVKRVLCDKIKEKSVRIFIRYKRPFSILRHSG